MRTAFRRQVRRHTIQPILAAAALGALGCFVGSDITDPTGPGYRSPASEVSLITLNPASIKADSGAVIAIGIVLKDQAGNPVGGTAAAWSSSDSTVASVSLTGVVTLRRPGRAMITAAAGQVSASVTATVDTITVASVSVSPASISLNPGQTEQFVATMHDSSGEELTGRPVSWSSSSSAATVSGDGLVTAVSIGSTTITARSEGHTATAQVTVTTTPALPVASVSVTPASASLTVGQTRQLVATPLDASGNAVGGATVTWSTSASGVATVSASGLVTAITGGSATVTATSQGKSGTAAVTVISRPSVASVAVSPTSASLTVGQTQQLTATPLDASGNVVSGATVTWSTTNSGVASVSTSGLVTGAAAGTATITATSQGQSGTSIIAVAGAGQPQPDILNAWSLGLNGTVPHVPSTPPTANNPDGVVTWGGPSDPGVSVNGPGTIVSASQFPSGKAMQFPDGRGADFQFGSPITGINVVYVQLEMSFGSGGNAPNESGNFKFVRTRGAGYSTLNGSLIIQNNQLNGFFDVWEANPEMHVLVPDVTALNDGQVHTLKVRFESDATPSITLWIDGALQGTVRPTNTYTVPPAGVTSIVQLFETVNNAVGGLREVDRVSISTQDIPAFP